jgi:hypothetical protein
VVEGFVGGGRGGWGGLEKRKQDETGRVVLNARLVGRM